LTRKGLQHIGVDADVVDFGYDVGGTKPDATQRFFDNF